jgi:hypothetical protein
MSAAQYHETFGAEFMETGDWDDALDAAVAEIRDDIVSGIQTLMEVGAALDFSQGYDNGLYAAREFVKKQLQ